ncbi:hypothetical protein pEaSNUABM38_00172 [Erwinia phage pEa_SNUABM_38]|nr:hypothetical protein pEaSNUABM38_00172 [Erwinia phage pEa_SNUABM_38]
MFKVNRIKLKGFTGMALHDVAEFDFSIKTPITIILGGNGSGKTSLLSVYFPVCPPKEDLKDGGSYTNYCQMDDVRYKCYVKRTGGTLHCSITNLETNEEIVSKVNPKVYNANIEDLFGLTKERKDLLNGESILTRAGTSQRRQWFTMLSTSNLTYALGFYTRLRKHLTALGNQADYVRGKIAETKVRVVEDETERLQLEERLKVLEAEISKLAASLASTPATDPNVDENYIRHLLAQCADVSKFVVGGQAIPVQDDIDSAQLTIQNLNASIQSWGAVYTERNKALSALMDEEARQQYLMRNHSGLKEQLVQLTATVQQYEARDYLFKSLFDVQLTIDELKSANDAARDFAHTLQTNVDALTTRETIRSIQESLIPIENRITELSGKVVTLERLLAEDQAMLQHIRDTDEVSCPNCSHTFKPGVGKLTETDLQQRILAGTNHITVHTTEINGQRREQTALLDEMKRLQAIREIVMTYSRDRVLSILFKKLTEEGAFRENRSKFGGIVTAFFDEVTEATHYLREKLQLEKTREEWAEIARAQGNVDTTLEARLAVQRDAVNEALQSKYNVEGSLKHAQAQLDSLLRTKAAVENFKVLEGRLESAMRLYSNNLAVKEVEDFRDMRWDQYSVARERYRLMQQELDKLAELEKELERLLKHQHTAKLMVTSFSPEKGVLRRHFFNSIARVTEMMSSYIEHVWAYPMQVLPCDMSEGDLDYRFPYRLKDNPEPVFDICKGSAAQRDIFDLTFRLTAYRCLGLKQYPLLLDEPGATFDEAHRNELVDFLKMLLNSDEFSQIIVISHNSEVHSKLVGADYCVLESEGITPPPVYNQNVKITYTD